MLIGVDHGNKQIKTVHGEPFVSGLQQSLTRPFGQSLQYCGTYYTLSNERIPFHKDKTEDDRFFVLTLIAIAEEITARGIGEKNSSTSSWLLVCPRHILALKQRNSPSTFKAAGLLSLCMETNTTPSALRMWPAIPRHTQLRPQCCTPLLDDPKAVVLDIGGFTADYLLLKNGKADLASCDSLENGVILLYNKIRSRGNAELDLLLDEGDVDAIPHGQTDTVPGRGRTACGATGAGVCQRLVQHFTRADVGFALLQSGVCGRRRYSAAPADRGFRQGGNASVRHEHQRQCSWI